MVANSIGPHWAEADAFVNEWRKQRRRIEQKQQGATHRKPTLLIFPSDPDTVIGSKGDEAMLFAYLSRVNGLSSDTDIVILCRSDEAVQAIRRLGFKTKSVWATGWAVEGFAEILNEVAPDRVLIMGADIMDGYYHPTVSAERYAFADLSTRVGIPTTILGFSFASRPVPQLADIIKQVDKNVKFGLRDPASLERWRTFCETPASLVADVAFLLDAADEREADKDVDAWIARERALGRTVLGLNIHQLILGSERRDYLLDQLARSVRDAIEHGISWLLIPHDVREPNSDLACLRDLKDRLPGDNCLVVDRELSAAQLKRLSGLLDGIVTGRMHLAIAGLGMGTPVAAFGYLDKFEGLFEHFGVDSKYSGNLKSLADKGEILTFILDFRRDLSSIRMRVRERLPAVTSLAIKNLELQSAPRQTARTNWFSRLFAR